MAGNHLNPSGDGNLVEADDSADESAERILESVTSDNLSDGGNHIDSKVEEGEKLTSNDYLLSNITELKSKMVQMGNENRRLQVKIEEQEFNMESLLSEVGGPMSMEGSPALASSANIPWRNCNETYRDLPVLRDATDKDSVSDGANRRETLTRLDNYEKENSHFFKLNEDIFSYLVCYPLKSIPSLYSMCTIFFPAVWPCLPLHWCPDKFCWKQMESFQSSCECYVGRKACPVPHTCCRDLYAR